MSNSLTLAGEYSQGAKPEFAEIVMRLAKIISSYSVKLDAAIKWKQLMFALKGDFHHRICAIGITNLPGIPLRRFQNFARVGHDCTNLHGDE